MTDSLAARRDNARSDIDRIKAEHRSLAMLRFLHREPSYGSNERIVAAYLDLLAIGGGCDEIRSALDDLERLGLLRVERRAGLMVVWLTRVGVQLRRSTFCAGRAIGRGKPSAPSATTIHCKPRDNQLLAA